jgi:hypothetical protein
VLYLAISRSGCVLVMDLLLLAKVCHPKISALSDITEYTHCPLEPLFISPFSEHAGNATHLSRTRVAYQVQTTGPWRLLIGSNFFSS